MPYWRFYYHVVWATKFRVPMIVDAMIDPIVQSIAETSRELDVVVMVVSVMPDHIHVLAQIPPSQAVARVVGRWKGASSHAANEHCPDAEIRLAWQSGYGVLSVSESGVDRVLAYVQNQRERHAAQQTYGVLERAEDD